MAKNVVILSLSLPAEMVDRIKELAVERQQKVSMVVKVFIENGLRQTDVVELAGDLAKKGATWERAVEGLKTDSEEVTKRARELAKKAARYEEWAEGHEIDDG